MHTLRTVAVEIILVGALLSVGATAPTRASSHDDHTPLSSQQTRRAVRATTLLGATVVTSEGTRLGTLDDLVIDAVDAQVVMIVVSRGWRFGLGRSFVALPWYVARPLSDGKIAIVFGAEEAHPHAQPDRSAGAAPRR